MVFSDNFLHFLKDQEKKIEFTKTIKKALKGFILEIMVIQS